MLVQINEANQTIRMVSIPRDLFVNRRKINEYYALYGADYFTRLITDLTGFSIDHTMFVDMLAFVDLIDAMGGVDVTLSTPLVDPTYRTVDAGKEGTLYYEIGTHHLGGIEALRLARSRHTTSDFSRSERQQLIFKAMLAKARSFELGSARSIAGLLKTILTKTDTSFTFSEALSYYYRYQSYSVDRTSVLSTANVLTSPPYILLADCQRMIEEAMRHARPIPDCLDHPHAYTLIPLNDDWDLIRNYIKEVFNG
ncbi:LCP family protein [Candidatus Peregrinibacteria bacterium]|nr:MAG: LCP family protein [Candidatus Peregrinibacteria bacterium]